MSIARHMCAVACGVVILPLWERGRMARNCAKLSAMTKPMRVLIACERSGKVREAFRKRGHDAYSCDIVPADDGSNFHIIADANFVINYPQRVIGHLPHIIKHGWDLLIAHPPCTYLSNSGVRWLYEQGTRRKVPARWRAMREGADFFRMFLDAPIDRIAVENPVMHGHAARLIDCPMSQSIQPWQFGHGEVKRTCLWLKNLPLLVPTNIVDGRQARIHRLRPSVDRGRLRSVTYQGIADAMAEQWG